MSSSFSDLGVAPELVARLRAQGIDRPFPIQSATIPDALAGRDVCGRAPTGSGKTLAFGVAVVMNGASSSAPRRPGSLVLVPTRELAAQVQGELALLAGDQGRRIIAVYGGTGYGPTRHALARGVDTVVACPGRLEDLVAQGAIDLGGVQVVVLDEADRMADMGFLPSVRRLLDRTAASRQVLLFSATLGAEVETLVRHYQTDPVRHDVVGDDSDGLAVAHLFWKAPREDRVRLTAGLVGEHGRALIFCRTRRGADRVARQLKDAGVPALAIHGDRTQAQRERALAAFARGQTKALVATDVAARGIHVDDLACVVHYDLPADATDYLHRSGRTGRAGKTGTVVSLVTDDQHAAIRSLQRALGFAGQLNAPDAPDQLAAAALVRAHPRPDRGPAAARSASPAAVRREGPRDATRTARVAPRTGSRTSPRTARFVPSAAPRGTAMRPVARGAMDNRRTGGRAPTGTVKFFNADKGYGFVSRPHGNDVFVHHSNVADTGSRPLEAGQQVEFDLAPGRRGEEARNVRVV